MEPEVTSCEEQKQKARQDRTVSFCDAALFSDFVGYIDTVLLESPLTIINYSNNGVSLDQLSSLYVERHHDTFVTF